MGMLNNPKTNWAIFWPIKNLYYTQDFMYKNLNPSEFNPHLLNILKEILSKVNPDQIQDNENTMYLLSLLR